MSNEFENNNDGGENNQNPYYQDFGLRHRGADSRITAIHIRADSRIMAANIRADSRIMVIHIRTDSRRTAVTTHMEMFR